MEPNLSLSAITYIFRTTSESFIERRNLNASLSRDGWNHQSYDAWTERNRPTLPPPQQEASVDALFWVG